MTPTATPTYTSFSNNPDINGVPCLPPIPVAGDITDAAGSNQAGAADVVQPVPVTMPSTPQP
jgi:hypothetical protein